MAVRTRGKKRAASTAAADRSTPKFPYTVRPNALRKFLAEVPKRPKPTKVNRTLLASWSLAGGANESIIRVLKAVGLLAPSGEPTEIYTNFMREGTGPAVLGQKIREVYAPIFEATAAPYKESTDVLKNLFNIHSGGAPATIDLQIQTFKALCDNASFEVAAAAPFAPGAPQATSAKLGSTAGASFHIDLHIHLPERASSRDYQYIIQDIGRFLLGKETAATEPPRSD
jgi:hypothetical protein